MGVDKCCWTRRALLQSWESHRCKLCEGAEKRDASCRAYCPVNEVAEIVLFQDNGLITRARLVQNWLIEHSEMYHGPPALRTYTL